MAQQNVELLKILIIGDSAVGKSCLLLRYTDNAFQETFMTTIGVDFKTKHMELDGTATKLQLWDTAGQEKFRAITKSYYRGAHGIILVFDVSKRETFTQVNTWLESIRDSGEGATVDVVLVGNKCDLARQVTTEEGEAYAKEHSVQYYETSAKAGDGVAPAFEGIARLALRKRKGGDRAGAGGAKQGVALEGSGNDQKKKGGCCK